MDGKQVAGSVCIFDDDYYYLAAVIAVKLARAGCDVILVSTEGRPAVWCDNTEEQSPTHQQLLSLGVGFVGYHAVNGFDGEQVKTACIFSGTERIIAAMWLVPVTSREPQDEVYRELDNNRNALTAAGMQTLVRIGDCEAPGIIAGAIRAGHKIGREIGRDVAPQKRDR